MPVSGRQCLKREKMITTSRFDRSRSNRYSIGMIKPLPKISLFAFLPVFLSGCIHVNLSSQSVQPPIDDSEGVVSKGNAAAELLVKPETLLPDGEVIIQVANRGETALEYGRPFSVEKWTEEGWRETEASQNSFWTMELLHLEPGETGVEQKWPFPDETPAPARYRISKLVHSQTDSREPLVIRAQIEVKAPAN